MMRAIAPRGDADLLVVEALTPRPYPRCLSIPAEATEFRRVKPTAARRIAAFALPVMFLRDVANRQLL